MPESVPPDPARVEAEIEALEDAVDRLLAELEALRERAERAEREHGELRRVLTESGVSPRDPASLEGRLRELTEENSRLRAVIREARERAERIRGRLIVIEDEAAS